MFRTLCLFSLLCLTACTQNQLTANSPAAPLPEPIASERLFGVEWHLKEMAQPPSDDSVLPEKLLIRFSADGKVSGFAGCNLFSGSFENAPEGMMTFGQMAATRRFCVQGMKTEYAFFRHLEAVKFWKLEAVKGEN
ncbi:MAG: META domain-containing protein, partial [Azoarcus sp.]|nr:META domain-containing protein [Azoarcus sp.]